MKIDSVASFVHNNSLRSFVTSTGCVFLCCIQRYFRNSFTTIIKVSHKNKANCVEQKNKQTKISPCEPSRLLEEN